MTSLSRHHCVFKNLSIKLAKDGIEIWQVDSSFKVPKNIQM